MATGKPALAQSSAVLGPEKWGPAPDDAEHITNRQCAHSDAGTGTVARGTSRAGEECNKLDAQLHGAKQEGEGRARGAALGLPRRRPLSIAAQLELKRADRLLDKLRKQMRTVPEALAQLHGAAASDEKRGRGTALGPPQQVRQHNGLPCYRKRRGSWPAVRSNDSICG